MARKDVTNNNSETFEELAQQLREQGFNVDHFHASDGEWITHFNDDGNGHFIPDGPCDVSPQGWVSLMADEWHG